jgi:hypothetical protein
MSTNLCQKWDWTLKHLTVLPLQHGENSTDVGAHDDQSRKKKANQEMHLEKFDVKVEAR